MRGSRTVNPRYPTYIPFPSPEGPPFLNSTAFSLLKILRTCGKFTAPNPSYSICNMLFCQCKLRVILKHKPFRWCPTSFIQISRTVSWLGSERMNQINDDSNANLQGYAPSGDSNLEKSTSQSNSAVIVQCLTWRSWHTWSFHGEREPKERNTYCMFPKLEGTTVPCRTLEAWKCAAVAIVYGLTEVNAGDCGSDQSYTYSTVH